MNKAAQSLPHIPLVVDVDGTLVKTDTLHEAFVELISRHPIKALSAVLALKHGRAKFKEAVADQVSPHPTIPLNDTVLKLIKETREEGRRVYLATAADKRFAEAIARTIGGVDGIYATECGVNLKGQTKAESLIAAFGERGFDYVGNDSSDMPVWRAARMAFAAGASRTLIERVNLTRPNLIILDDGGGIAFWPYLWAMRPLQWLKNLLVAVPAIAAHDFSAGSIIAVVAAFLSFSLGASSVYLVNDMLDLPNDRAHQEKRHRPLAAGTMHLSEAVVLSGILAAASIGLALLLPFGFLAALGGYFGLAFLYSFYLKRKLMIDVVVLAALYGIRVVAGGTTVGIPLSHWLVGFCFFIFLSLALMKRTTEIMLLPDTSVDKIKGRGYRRADLPIINGLMIASGFIAVLVLALYINSPEIRLLYARPDLLWGICVVLVYWLGRAFFLVGRGEMQQDPVVFAATDRISFRAGLVIAAIFLVAL